jgi:ketosteroid isomerase-like protein
MSPTSADREEVGRVLGQITEAWRTGHPERLHDHFHEDMVIVGPAYREMGRGREACVRSYAEFLGAATVQEYRESAPVVQAWAGTAVATYEWEMTYALDGRVHRERGTDLFVFAREQGRWLAVWRAVQPAAQAS